MRRDWPVRTDRPRRVRQSKPVGRSDRHGSCSLQHRQVPPEAPDGVAQLSLRLRTRQRYCDDGYPNASEDKQYHSGQRSSAYPSVSWTVARWT
jgi:hypothetical protein